MLNLLYITLLAVFIIDLSGITDQVPEQWGVLHKLLTCSLCVTWWSGLGWLILTGDIIDSDNRLNLEMIALVALFAYNAINIKNFIIFVNDTIIKIINSLR